MGRDRQSNKPAIRQPRSPFGLLGAVATVVLGFGISTFIGSTVRSDPGAMDRAYGQLVGIVCGVMSVGILFWAGVAIRRLEHASRRREWMTIGTVGALSALVFGVVTLGSVTSHLDRESALAATASWREDFEADLGDSYKSWYADIGGTETVYTGNYYEWWSLDPDRDGELESDAPILRTLNEHGWSARGISILDNDGDAVVDQLQWVSGAVTDSGVWCIPVIQPRGSANLIVADWGSAAPAQCG